MLQYGSNIYLSIRTVERAINQTACIAQCAIYTNGPWHSRADLQEIARLLFGIKGEIIVDGGLAILSKYSWFALYDFSFRMFAQTHKRRVNE